MHQSVARDGDDEAPRDDVWPITGTLLIGRENADVTLGVPAMSGRHASVETTGHGYRIRDLGSKNGTAVNGVLLDGAACRLTHDDRIVLASAVELRFHDPGATPVAPRLGTLRGLWIDSRSRDVWVDAERVTPPLSDRQHALLALVVDAGGRLVDKAELVERLWPRRTVDTLSMDAVGSLIKCLRRRLVDVEHGEPVLEVRRGHGIRLRIDR